MRMFRLVFCFVWLLPGLVLYSLPGIKGTNNAGKYFHNFIPLESSVQPQNWDIVQDYRGIIYAANNGGLIEYDGVSWRETEIPNITVRSLAADSNGRVYVGGRNELGLLALDANGFTQYISLIHDVEEDRRNFGSVWRTYATKEAIYYWTSRHLFQWNPIAKNMTVWQPESGIFVCLHCDGMLFIHQKKTGLRKWDITSRSPVPMPGGETLMGESVAMIVPYNTAGGTLLIGTRTNGLFLSDGKKITPFKTEIDDFLKQMKLYHGIRLKSSSGEFALATRLGGLIIIDSNGRSKTIYDKETGLRDNCVNDVFQDATGNVWLALNKGIAKIEYKSPLSIYDGERFHLQGIILSVVRAAPPESLYAGTTSGLFLKSPGGIFHPVPGIAGSCWSLAASKDTGSILAGTREGVYQVKQQKARLIFNTPTYVLTRSRYHDNRMWAGTSQGLLALSLDGEMWKKQSGFKKNFSQVRTIAEDDRGNLWLGTLTGNVFHIRFNGPVLTGSETVSAFGNEHGLPPGEIHVFNVDNHMIFATAKGLYRFDRQRQRFLPDFTLGIEFAGGADGKSVFRLIADRKKNIYFHSMRRNFRAIPRLDKEGGQPFIVDNTPFLRMDLDQVNAIYPDPGDEAIWFVTHHSLVRFDTRMKKDYHRGFSVLLRRVLINGIEEKRHFPVLPYSKRNTRFEFAAPFFEAEDRTLYSYVLQGYDKQWSPWTGETKKDYTNLDHGDYTFRVRAKNVYGIISPVDSFQLRVRAPWYRTWWAYVLYVSMLGAMVVLIVRWRSMKLVRDKQKLERIIRKRTKEIQDQKRLLEHQSDKLQEMDKVKSRFFANISHEFRTPLTLINGPLEQVLAAHKDNNENNETELVDNINLALHNSRRLLDLINQLLDLSKLDGGKMKLQAVRRDIVPFIRGVTNSFESLAAQKKIKLDIAAESQCVLYFDPEKLDKVLINLLANAIKFTPEGGAITVSAAIVSTSGKVHSDRVLEIPVLEIKVRDTGVGVPKDQLPYVFDRFFQAEGVFSSQHKGSGIGLAVVKELVELHHGDIFVHSTEGKGTEFTIHLPLDASRLEPDEMTEADPDTPLSSVNHPLDLEPESEPEHVANREENEKEYEKEHSADVILVVEDNADVRRFIRSPLEQSYTVIEAVNGKEGIEKARKMVPSLIVSDVMMPEIDGYELCQVLKTDIATSHIPIILLTAKASDENIIEGLETGADDYITKPFNTTILLTRIKNLIDLRRQLQEKIQRELVLQPTEIAVSSMDQTFMQELKQAIENNLSNAQFAVDDLAGALYLGRSTLNLKIRALTGESTNRFIQSYRLKRAAQLLKANFGNVTEVAFEVGFSSSAYFTKCFKEKFHRLPNEYRTS